MWSTVEAAAAAMAQGKFVVVVDNEDRENEGVSPSFSAARNTHIRQDKN